MSNDGRGGRKRGFQGAALPRLLALCMLLLGFAVVCWGLHDKLSLYAPPHADQPVAKAKLLTEQERMPQMHAAMPRPDVPPAPVFVLWFATALIAVLELKPRVMSREPRFARPPSPPLSEALHRRPPPEQVRVRMLAAAVCAQLA